MQEQRKFCHTDRWSARDDGETDSLLRPQRPVQPIIFAANPKSVETDLSRSAFLIIDRQNDFLSDDGWFATTRNADVTKLSSVIERINAIGQAFRAVGAPVIHINWAVRPDVANLPTNVLDKGFDCGTRPGYGDKIASGPALVNGDWGEQSIADIEIGEQDISIGKHRLTGFRDNALDQILRRLDVTTLFCAGVNLDRCVFATLADGCFNGFDGSSSRTPQPLCPLRMCPTQSFISYGCFTALPSCHATFWRLFLPITQQEFNHDAYKTEFH